MTNPIKPAARGVLRRYLTRHPKQWAAMREAMAEHDALVDEMERSYWLAEQRSRAASRPERSEVYDDVPW